MKLYSGACLCLVAAACSTNKPPENQPKPWNETTPVSAPAVTPASYGASAGPRPTAEHSAAPTSDRAPGRPNRGESADGHAAHPEEGGPALQNNPPSPTRPNAAKTNAKSGTAPDNTKVNKRDTNDAALTPIDQGNGETDLKITQQIRQAVIGDDSLSFTAKNVKIITVKGKVTLRGPVNTLQERASIEAAARKIAGAAQVDNQLEVKK